MTRSATGGYVDEHLHLLATAAARCSVDVTAAAAPTLAEVLERVRTAPRSASGWVRAWGFDDALVAERRAPTQAELDEAAPDRPVVVHHRSGHAEYRNRAAGRDPAPRLDLRGTLRELMAELRAAGIVRVVDATATNDTSTLELLRDAQLGLPVTVMLGADRLDPAHPFGSSAGGVTVGHAKISTPAEAVGPLVRQAHAAGWPVAVHVVELDVLEATLDAFEASPPPGGAYDRIEHLALSLPAQVDRIAALRDRVAVVTQPSFLSHRGTKYREQLTEVEHEWLYRVGSLVRRGVAVAFASDSPVVPADPTDWVRAATNRAGFAPGETVDATTADRLARGLPRSLETR